MMSSNVNIMIGAPVSIIVDSSNFHPFRNFRVVNWKSMEVSPYFTEYSYNKDSYFPISGYINIYMKHDTIKPLLI